MGKNTKKKSAGAASSSSAQIDLLPAQKELATLLVKNNDVDVIKRLLVMIGLTQTPELALHACDALFRISHRLETMREIIR
jgi:hypothetical protein